MKRKSELNGEATFPEGSPWRFDFGWNIGPGCSDERLETLLKHLSCPEREKELSDFEQRLLNAGSDEKWMYSQLLRLRAQPHERRYSGLIKVLELKGLLVGRLESENYLGLAVLALKFKDEETIARLLAILPQQRSWVVCATVDMIWKYKAWWGSLHEALGLLEAEDSQNYEKLICQRLKLALRLERLDEGRKLLREEFEARIARSDIAETDEDFFRAVRHLEFATELMETFGKQFNFKDAKSRCRKLRESAQRLRKRYPFRRFEAREEVHRGLVIAKRLDILQFRNISKILVSFASTAPWPSIEVQLEDAHENKGMMDHFPTVLIGSDGRHLTTIPDLEGNLRRRAFDSILFEASAELQLVVRPCFSRLKRRVGFAPGTVAEEICSSGLVREGRQQILLAGIKALFEREFFASAHILIPVFEDMIRQFMISVTGGQTWATRNTEQFATLHPMLQELKSLSEGVSPIIFDVATWWDWYFCDPVGRNVRNELAHGLSHEMVCEEVAWMTWLSILQLCCFDPADFE